MSAKDYAEALATNRARVALNGAVPATTWDPSLGRAMTDAGVAVFEEELRSSLLDSMLDRGG
jgi:hypothetical protein